MGLICLALGRLDEAKSWVEVFLLYNDNTPTRKRYYQVLNTVLDIALREDLDLDDYISSLARMYGDEVLGNATSSVSGKIRFFGLLRTNMKLDGIDKYLRLLESYEKLQVARNKFQKKLK